jgi:hypothetical protein
MEPLTCRGRRGTGIAGSRRSGYVDTSVAARVGTLEPTYDWQKYEYLYRVWGRLTYNPEASPEAIRRDNPVASFETQLSAASRILPIVTTAYLPSAACDAYWPEVYWNQPIVRPPQPNPYGDSPQPRTFQNASPLDPQLFSRMTDFADGLLKGERTGQYSPLEVAAWLDECAARSAGPSLFSASSVDDKARERTVIDLDILRGLGLFFAAKFRAGVLYAIYEKTKDRGALEQAVAAYRRARNAWADLSSRATGVYAADLSASDKISNRGAWADRLPAIDQDIADMAAQVTTAVPTKDASVIRAVQMALAPPRRSATAVTHQPPALARGADVALEFTLGTGQRVTSARLFYRHVNQAERYETLQMERTGNRYRARIPAAYADSPFALQYYVEFRATPADAWLYPGFAADRLNQPYFVLQRAG